MLAWKLAFLSYSEIYGKDALSNVDKLKTGVSQGSDLGPIQFHIFINHIRDDTIGCGRLFAADTSIGHA